MCYNFTAQDIRMTVTKRRIASTETIHHLWDAIVYVRQQKQIPNFERISNYMRRKHNVLHPDLQNQLECAVHDGLIEMKKRVGCKGTKVGVEQESYRTPEKELVRLFFFIIITQFSYYVYTCLE